MASLNLIRLGGLAAMTGGVGWVIGTSWWQRLDILLTVLLALSAMAAVAALHLLQRARYGWQGVLFSLVAAVGLAMILVFGVVNIMATVPEMDLPPLLDGQSVLLAGELAVGGLYVATVGLTALGIATLGAGVLPWWCGAALVVGSPAALFAEAALLDSLLWALLFLVPIQSTSVTDAIPWMVVGVPWVLVGYAIFRTVAGQREAQPLRGR